VEDEHLDAKLKGLEELQKLDMAVLDLQRSGEAFPKRLAELEGELKTAKTAWDVEEKRVEENEKQRRDLETRLEDEKEKVKKWESRLTEQRTTREYSALAREIDIAKKANVTLGEDLANLAKVREDLETAAMEKKEGYDAKQKTVGAEAQELRQKIAELDGRIAELNGKRAEVAKGADPGILARYENIRRKRMPALSVVRDGTCTGCRMRIPPQLYNQLLTGLPFDVCRSCARIIYVDRG
jgi:predicted  nucleic acid-binding Zn-ribbon protein